MVSIVVPAYNEEDAIEQTVAQITETMSRAKEATFEIIVVDDGSSDQTAERAEKAGARVIRKPANVGYGHSLKTGIAAAKFDTIVITDADGTYPIDRIPELLGHYRDGFDMVVGRRTGKYFRESLLKFPLRMALQWLIEFTVGKSVPDVNSGLRVFSRAEISKMFSILSNGFSFTTSSTMAYSLRNKYIKYVPIDYHKRIGSTKVRLLRDSLRVLQYIVQAIMYYNPIKLFLVLMMAVFAIGAGIGVIAMLHASALLGVLSFMAFMTGFILFAIGLLAEQRMLYLRISEDRADSGEN